MGDSEIYHAQTDHEGLADPAHRGALDCPETFQQPPPVYRSDLVQDRN
jgi:hypothetical protein